MHMKLGAFYNFGPTTGYLSKGLLSNETLEPANGVTDNFPLDKWMPVSTWRTQEEAFQPSNPGIPRSKEAVHFGYRCQSKSNWNILSQVDKGQEKVIIYFNPALTLPQQNYYVTRKELLAVIKSIKNFHKYLYD